MKLIRIVLLCIFACSINAEQPKNILFVGNSYLYYNNSVHNYVEFMLREHYDSDIETKLSAIGGSRLHHHNICLLYTSPSPRDMRRSRMPSSA